MIRAIIGILIGAAISLFFWCYAGPDKKDRTEQDDG